MDCGRTVCDSVMRQVPRRDCETRDDIGSIRNRTITSHTIPAPIDKTGYMRNPRHADVSAQTSGTFSISRNSTTSTRTSETTVNAPPHQDLSLSGSSALIDEGKGAAPDWIYARGVPDFPASPSPTSIRRSECTLLINV